MLLASLKCNAWEGKGMKNNPYQIKSCEQLLELATKVNNGTNYDKTYFKVTINELDFQDIEYIPIGDRKHPFSGVFDGNGVIIKNLVYNSSESFVGLFGNVGNGIVENITIDKSCSITGFSYVGGIAGYLAGPGGNDFTIRIYNCVNKANIKGTSTATNICYVGGIVGYYVGASISECSNYGEIVGNGGNVGGIVGYANGSWVKITDCHNRGDISGCIQKIGGIVGYMDLGIMSNCTVASCSINANSPYIGAVLGCNTNSKLRDNYYNDDVVVITYGTILNGTDPRGCGSSNGPIDIIENNGAMLGGVNTGLNEISSESEGGADYENNYDMNDNTDLNGTVIGNIYYNISQDNGRYNSAEGCIEITKPTDDDDIDGKDIFGENFKNHYTGIVFKVAAGSGTIKLKAETTGSMMLKVKVGSNEPYEMMLTGKVETKIPYNVTQPTYIYVYASSLDSSSPSRAGSTGSALKIYGLSWDDTTGIIENKRESEKDNIYYTIDGRKLNGQPTKKGVYIVNKQKVMVE